MAWLGVLFVFIVPLIRNYSIIGWRKLRDPARAVRRALIAG
jgi:hypothetical protein